MADPWEERQFIERLSFLPEDVPGAPESHRPDQRLPDPQQRPNEYLQFFRDHAKQHIDPELLEDREDVWEQEMDPENLPAWVTLKAPPNLRNWRYVIEQDLEIDKRATKEFIHLVNLRPHGFNEAARALAHCMKDKKGTSHSSPSQWMQTTCQEAVEALETPEMWDRGPEASWGPGPSHGKGDGSTKGPGKGKGSTKGPGNYHQGLR